MHFDLLIKGGELVDPGAGHHGFFDIGIFRGQIASVDRSIPAAAALRTIDSTGMIAPGLVDLHTHVYRNATLGDPRGPGGGANWGNDLAGCRLGRILQFFGF